MFADKPLCFVDLETTGARVSFDRIIEVGILKVVDNEVVDVFETLVNPQIYLSPFITGMTGITPDELEGAPTFESIKKEVYGFLEESIFVAHNVRFDYGFIRNEFMRSGISYTAKQICTVKLSRMLYPRYKRHNLDSIMERFGIPCARRHRALDDAKAMFSFFQKTKQAFSSESIEEAIAKLLKKPTVPVNLPAETLDDLPESPGVYIFYGDGKIPLYIGKSRNIRNRVMSHFTGDNKSSKTMNMCQQIKDIKTIQTAGELGALLKESELIKELQPLYNQTLRIRREIVTIRRKTNLEGFETAYIDTAARIDPLEIESILGIFKTKKSAKEFLVSLCKEYELCEHLLDIAKGPGSCFSNKLGVCRGACIKKELFLRYNMRFLQAFSERKLKRWPFDGPIAICEESISGTREFFIIDNWCFLGSVQQDETDNLTLDSERRFDYDIYKILARFIFSDSRSPSIIPLSSIKKSPLISG